VFVVNQGQQADFGLNGLPQANVLPWTLPVNYTSDQLAKLAAEMFWFQEEATIEEITKLLLRSTPAFGQPVGLARLARVYKAIEDERDLLVGVGRMR